LLATADGLTVHDPVLLPYMRIDLREQVGCFQWVAELGLEDDGEGLDVDEEVFA
jgi:hypothetical protein